MTGSSDQDAVSLQIESDPDEQTLATIAAGLRAFDPPLRIPRDSRRITLTLRDAERRVVGGVTGFTYWDWFHILQLWVDASQQGRGLASRLLLAAEAEAVKAGCRHAYLDTFTFQARPFYEKLGYTVFGTLDDYPPGHQLFFMCKRDLDRSGSHAGDSPACRITTSNDGSQP
jgi:GNAT superfamily N-acetyltransferase